MKLGIVSTVYNKVDTLETWLKYHGAFVDRIFLYPDEPTEIPEHPKVRVLPGSQESTFSGPSGVMERQVHNVRHAVPLCKEEGIDWLFHIDDDELIYTEGSLHEFFSDLPSHIGQVRIFNHEILHTKMDVKDCFAECNTFKYNVNVNPVKWDFGKFPYHYLFYGNGKSVVKVSAFKEVNNVHMAETEGGLWTEPSLAILHYPCASYDSWFRKYKRLASWGDFWYDDPTQPIEVKFHTRSRDVVNEALEKNDEGIARDFYASILVNKQDEDRLVKEGVCFRL